MGRLYTKDGSTSKTGVYTKDGSTPKTGASRLYTKDGGKPLQRAVFPTGF